MAKNQFIRARVAGWEKDCIRRKADAAHMTESEFVRRAAMGREVTVIEGMDELLRELRYQGNNLNQLTVMARQGRITQVNYEPFTEVYFDFEAYGRDVRINDGGHFAPGGYVFNNGGSFVERYHGMENIPPEHRIFAYPKLNIREQMAAYQEVIDRSALNEEKQRLPASREER